MTALISGLAGGPGGDQMLLILDDYHMTGAREVHAPVGLLLEHRPETPKLLLASRPDPPLR